MGHLGHYRCPRCGATRPRPDVAATRIELGGMAGSQVEVATPEGTVELLLPLPGLYNVYNALAALAAAGELGIDAAEAAAGIDATQAAFGRVETIDVDGVPVSILLIKNPAGANEVLRTLRLEVEREGGAARLDLWLALNDRIADGRDVSWIWDADLELLSEIAGRAVCTGTRAAEMAVRLKYAGVDPARIEVREGIDESLDLAVAGARGRVFALPTYTALIELRRLLARRGLAAEYWR
jgi:UDP-N-acetylmuramyl tripeptide synthase